MERILPFTPEHEMLRRAFSDFLDNEVVPYYNEWEEKGIVPREVYKKMGDYGFLCPWVDEKYGGAGADFLASVVINEEIGSKGVISFFSFLHSDIVAPYIASYGTEDQKARWLPKCVSGDIILAIAMTEPGAGSDLAAMRTRAVKDGDHYILNGSKTFISNGILADLVVVAAKTDPAAGAKGVSLFLVERDTPGFIRSRQIPKIGLHAQDTAELFFEDCRVPASNLLGKEGNGFIYLMQKLQQERLLAAIVNVTLAERCLKLTLDYVKQRHLFGKPLSSFQNTQFVLAEIATEIQLARGFVDTLVLHHMAGKDVVQEVSMAKYWVCEMSHRVANRCVQLFGGYGYCTEYEISRLWADTRVQSIYAGTSEVMKLIIARGLGL
ncbi:acyl-CoA dehydrogenase family protein [Syntrophothermus lipocalidus]|uniref:Acyl-[acyl-carrier-protein] dehydrogenase MbtN n=1 Tax=Syntrophothermus lipocalidus (strain DSM 12680 / TGB-C1) TaxID=643648 RepID=D7CPV9_SYNLT|nr:acyl-CoA dehydrogenase family protein [Syntrophothermus lipocalidus]ADI02737.1 acyl-CoA dehydrogenase domain protein [Syntrophothermus lipocalidus DSM 12680]HOV42921.1 acyl-CoA dehydrogenase family protein [Syntrophothermus lipocalidus]